MGCSEFGHRIQVATRTRWWAGWLNLDHWAILGLRPSLRVVREWDSDFLRCAVSAFAAAKGSPEVGDATQELTPEVASTFQE